MTATRRPGRPTTGRPIQVRLDGPLLAQLDAWADSIGVTRADAIRRIIWAGLND